MSRRVITVIVILAVLLLLPFLAPVLSGKEVDKAAPEEQAKGGILNEAIELWDSGKKEESIQVFLSVNNPGTRPVATGRLIDSGQDLAGLSRAEQEKDFRETEAALRTLRDVARRAAEIGKKQVSSGQTELPNEYFSAIAESGRAIARPDTPAGLVGEALIRLSQKRE